MGQATLFEAHQRVRISLLPMDTTISAEVVGFDRAGMHIRLREPLVGLEPHHLDGGVRVSFWRDGSWHVADPVEVLGFNLDTGTVRVSKPKRTFAVQRRKTFREAVEVPVHLAVVGNLFPPAEIGHETVDLAAQSGATQDIGGDGVCLQCTGPAPHVDQEVRLELELPNNRIQARGKVRWSASDDTGQGRCGVMFTRISEREQDLVYGFLFDLQRNRLRKSISI
ncbi:MAG: PilZ domain-containing protein [Myxococcales bacterium]|nr:PilZ domain-containing protein [Myxococcales bacterium]